MRCELVMDFLDGTRLPTGSEQRQVLEHLSVCDDCHHAWVALEALRDDRESLIRVPSEGALQRAVLRAAQFGKSPGTSRAQQRVFWRGVGAGVGAVLAASLLVALVIFRPVADGPEGAAAPQVTLALNESREVSVVLDSPAALSDAEIHVVLSGAIGLRGFDDERELRWRTDLDRGVNRLTLPLVAFGPGGGQVLVEVTHGEKRRSFVVDVRTNTSRGSADVG